MTTRFYLPEALLPREEKRDAWLRRGDFVLEEG